LNPELKVLVRGKKYCGKTKKHVKITANMGSFLHYILTNISYKDNAFTFTPDEETRRLLATFNFYDLVDTYSRLGLNRGVYGDFIVNKSRVYVIKKTQRVYHTKHYKEVKQNE